MCAAAQTGDNQALEKLRSLVSQTFHIHVLPQKLWCFLYLALEKLKSFVSFKNPMIFDTIFKYSLLRKIHVSLMFTKGGNISSHNQDGRTALHVACREGHVETVQYLLHQGASVHVKDRNGVTPLLDAVKEKHSSIIGLLMESGAVLTLKPIVLAMELCRYDHKLIHSLTRFEGNLDFVRTEQNIRPKFGTNVGKTHIAWETSWMFYLETSFMCISFTSNSDFIVGLRKWQLWKKNLPKAEIQNASQRSKISLNVPSNGPAFRLPVNISLFGPLSKSIEMLEFFGYRIIYKTIHKSVTIYTHYWRGSRYFPFV